MKHIMLAAKDTEAIAFDLAHLAAYLGRIHDPRHKQGRIYPLGMILALIFLAKLAGEDKPFGITEWIRLRCDEFVRLFDFKHQRMPCLNIIRGVLQAVVSVEELEAKLREYLHEVYGGQQSELVVIDGKTMRGTIPAGSSQGVHLLAAYLPAEGVVLKQVEVGAKQNEISMAPALIEGLELKNRVVCGDAMHTQRELSVEVLAQGGDYLWLLKDNQPGLLADVAQFFQPPQKSAGWPLTPLPYTVAHTTQKQNGRLERRTLTLIVDKDGFLDWPGVCQVVKLERQVLHLRTGVQSSEVVYAITSCSPQRASADQLLFWIRQYWAIENSLHYRRDVTLREDATRITQPALARAIAAINNFVVALSMALGYSNLAAARRSFNAQIAAQLP